MPIDSQLERSEVGIEMKIIDKEDKGQERKWLVLKLMIDQKYWR